MRVDDPAYPTAIGAALHLSADAAITYNAWTQVPLDVTEFGSSRVSGSSIVIDRAGIWTVTAGITWSQTAQSSTLRALLLRLNGSGSGYNGTALADIRMAPLGSVNDQGLSTARTYSFAVGDVIELVGFHDVSSGLSAKSTTRTYLTALFEGPA